MTQEIEDRSMDAVPLSVPASPFSVSASPVSARQFTRHIVWTLVVRILMVVNSVVAGIIVARWLGAEGVGQLGVINVSVVMVVQLGSFGLPSANTYFIAKDPKQFIAAAMNSLFFAVVVGSALAFALIALARWRPDWFGFISPDLIRIAAISIPFQLVTLISLNIFLALGNVRRFNLLDLVGQSFVLLNAFIVLVVLHRDLWTLVSLNTWANVAIGVLLVVLVGIHAARLKAGHETWSIDFRLLERMLRYGFKFHISIIMAALIFRADLLIVNNFRGAAEAGVYSVASQIGMMLMLLPGVIGTLLFPRATAAQDPTGDLTARVTRHTAFVMFFICLAAVPLSFLLPSLYGAGFSDVVWQVLILLLGVYLIGLQSVLVQHFNAMGMPSVIPKFWLTTLLTNIVLVFLLVPKLGGRGAALASTLSYTLMFTLVLFYFSRTTSQKLSKVLLLEPSELRKFWTR